MHRPNNTYYLLPVCCLVFIIQSCINEDINNISDNIPITQSFSIPVAQASLVYNNFDPTQSTDIPGLYGSLYYNSLIFPNNFLYLVKTAKVEFNLSDSKNRQDWIKRVDFRVLIGNDYPSDIFTQIYELDASDRTIDSVFISGPQLIGSAEINAQGEAISSNSQLFDMTFEGTRLVKLKTSNNLLYKIWINTVNKKVTSIRLNDDSRAIINLGVRLLLEYNLQDTSQ